MKMVFIALVLLGPFATASRRTPPVTIDVHKDNDNNDTLDRGDRYGPIEWAQST